MWSKSHTHGEGSDSLTKTADKQDKQTQSARQFLYLVTATCLFEFARCGTGPIVFSFGRTNGFHTANVKKGVCHQVTKSKLFPWKAEGERRCRQDVDVSDVDGPVVSEKVEIVARLLFSF